MLSNSSPKKYTFVRMTAKPAPIHCLRQCAKTKLTKKIYLAATAAATAAAIPEFPLFNSTQSK